MPDYENLIAGTCRSWKDGRLSREEVSGEDVNKCLYAGSQACLAATREFLKDGMRISMLQLTLPEGEDVPLERYCDDVLIRRALRRGEQALDEFAPVLMRSLSAAQRPELQKSVRNERVVLPLQAKDLAKLEHCHYERMPETSQVPGRFFDTNTVVETFRNVLHYEPFMRRLREIATFYRSSVDTQFATAPTTVGNRCLRTQRNIGGNN